MTISFDAIWIPTAVTILAVGWAALVLRDPSYEGLFIDLTFAIAWPSIPVLGSWLIWALLT